MKAELIFNPHKYDIVTLITSIDKNNKVLESKDVLITGGYYQDDLGRVSNFFYWKPIINENNSIKLGKEEHGYPIGFIKCKKKYKISIQIRN